MSVLWRLIYTSDSLDCCDPLSSISYLSIYLSIYLSVLLFSFYCTLYSILSQYQHSHALKPRSGAGSHVHASKPNFICRSECFCLLLSLSLSLHLFSFFSSLDCCVSAVYLWSFCPNRIMTASDPPTDGQVQSPNAQSHYSKHIVVCAWSR